MENFIEKERQPIVQIWKNETLVHTLCMDSEWFVYLAHDPVMIKDRPFVAKFGYVETVITDVAEFTTDRR